MKRTLTLLLAAALIVCLFAGCSSMDYKSAEALESALNKGENVTGKTASVKIDNIQPGLLNLYYAGWAGEHLNLISENQPDFEVGDTVKIQIAEASDMFGSWMIAYEIIQ